MYYMISKNIINYFISKINTPLWEQSLLGDKSAGDLKCGDTYSPERLVCYREQIR